MIIQMVFWKTIWINYHDKDGNLFLMAKKNGVESILTSMFFHHRRENNVT